MSGKKFKGLFGLRQIGLFGKSNGAAESKNFTVAPSDLKTSRRAKKICCVDMIYQAMQKKIPEDLLEEQSNTYEITVAEVLREELEHIKHNVSPDSSPVASHNQTEKLDDVFEKLHDANFSALCFSGGGIRSATFGLGIVQALAKHGLLDKFEYLSTVSGGGYLGSWLSAWIRREQVSEFGANLHKNGESCNSETDNAELHDGKLFEKYKNIQDAGIKTVKVN